LVWRRSYAAYVQSQSVLPVFLAFIGVAFYTLRGYSKYIEIFAQMTTDRDYLDKSIKEARAQQTSEVAVLGFGLLPTCAGFSTSSQKFSCSMKVFSIV
jgi:hypothetical protein